MIEKTKNKKVAFSSETDIFYKKNISILLAKTSMLLAIAIILNIVSDKFLSFPIAPFLNFDFSLICIIFTMKYVGYKYGLLQIFILLFLGPTWSNFGYSIEALLGHFILALVQLSFSSIFIVFDKLLFTYFDKKESLGFFKKNFLANLISLVLATFLATIFLTTINIFLTTPAFLKIYLFRDSKESVYWIINNDWSKYKLWSLGIENYYVGFLFLYLSFNIINLSLNSALLIWLLVINNKAKFIKKY